MCQQGGLEAQAISYDIAKRNRPEGNPNAWLMWAISSRAGWASKTNWFYLLMAAPHSVMKPDDAPLALGIYVLMVEGGQVLEDRAPTHLKERFASAAAAIIHSDLDPASGTPRRAGTLSSLPAGLMQSRLAQRRGQ